MSATGQNITALTRQLSPRDNLRVLLRAFIGPRHARRLHRYYLENARTIKAGLDVISSRWPMLASKSDAAPIFVFSAGWRSGSTLLQRMILASNEVFMWGEPYRHSALIDSLGKQVRAITYKNPGDGSFVKGFGGSELSRQWVANLYPEMQSFLDAHVQFFECLFARPPEGADVARWGIKEVTLGVDHAHYLKWLFPQAKFVFLMRNPYDSYRSYRQWSAWYKSWPAEPVFTPTAFGRLWRGLAEDYAAHHAQVGGLLLRYEQLAAPETGEMLHEYLDCPVAHPHDLPRIDRPAHAFGSVPKWLPKIERALLRRQVEPVASACGYLHESAPRQ